MPDSCWVVTKLTDFSRHADHVYLDVLESEGKEIAKARVTKFANVAGNVIAERERVTGGLPPGGHTRAAQGASRVLATIRFSLNATGLDRSYALGDMQAKLQEIIFLPSWRSWSTFSRLVRKLVHGQQQTALTSRAGSSNRASGCLPDNG